MKGRKWTRCFVAVIAGLALLQVACSHVKPWERDVLSKPEMAWEPDALGGTLDSHIHFSKEASLQGGSAGGGGCGCN